MLDRRWRNGLVVHWIGILVLLLVAWASGSQDQICEINKQTGHENCTTHDMFFVIWWHLGIFFDEHSEAVTAVFTIVLAGSTIGLWWSTLKLWVAGKDAHELNRMQFFAAHGPQFLIKRMHFAEPLAANSVARVAMTLTNTGSATAILKKCEGSLYWREPTPTVSPTGPGTPWVFDEYEGPIAVPVSRLAPGQSCRIEIRSKALYPGDGLIMAPGARFGYPVQIYVAARFAYADEIGRIRETAILRQFMPPSYFNVLPDPEYEYET
jgi:hypothetical protein